MGDDFVAGHGDQGLRRGADDRVLAAGGVLEAEEVHVGAGVGVPQDPVDVQGVGAALHFEAAGDHHLEDLAVHDRLLAAVQGGQVLGLVPAFLHAGREIQGGRSPARRPAAPRGVLILSSRALTRATASCQASSTRSELLSKLMALAISRTVPSMLSWTAMSVTRFRAISGSWRSSSGGLVSFSQCRTVSQPRKPDQAGGERRQAVEALGAQRGDGVADGVHGVAVQGHTDRGLAQPVRAAVLGGQGGPGAGADEGVAGPGAADRRRFHQERSGLALGELAVQPDRGFGVSQHLEPDGDDPAVACEFAELLEARADDSKVLHGCAFRLFFSGLRPVSWICWGPVREAVEAPGRSAGVPGA